MRDVTDIGITKLLELSQQPTLLILAGCLVIVFALCVNRPRLGIVALGVLIFLSMPSPAVDYLDRWIQPPRPLDTLVLYSRSVTAVLVMVMTVALLFQLSRVGDFKIPTPLIWLFAIQAFLCIRVGIGGMPGEAIARLMVFALIFIGLGVALPVVMRARGQISTPVIAMGIAITLFAVANLYYMAVDFHQGFRQDRWLGINGNPNQVGMIVAVFTPAVLGLIVWKGTTRPLRLMMIGVLGLLLVMLLLTGSRGSAATLIIGVVMFFRVQLGRFVFFAIPIALAGMLILQQLDADSATQFERITSLEDTRSGVYQVAIEQLMKKPFFGAGDNFNYVENAYLTFVNKTGLLGAIVLAAAIASVFKLVFQCLLVRRNMGQDAPIADAGIAGMMAIGANSMIEATFMANLSSSIFAIYFYVTIMYLCVHFYATPVSANAAISTAPAWAPSYARSTPG